jgi:Sensors of blue-light using FAD
MLLAYSVRCCIQANWPRWETLNSLQGLRREFACIKQLATALRSIRVTTSQTRIALLSHVESRMLKRLIYASEPEATLPLDAVQSILTHARAANLRNNLTGLLAFDAAGFLQVLEG